MFEQWFQHVVETLFRRGQGAGVDQLRLRIRFVQEHGEVIVYELFLVSRFFLGGAADQGHRPLHLFFREHSGQRLRGALAGRVGDEAVLLSDFL